MTRRLSPEPADDSPAEFPSSSPSLEDLLEGIRRELDAVEDHLFRWSESANPTISEVSRTVFRKNGKRLRPALLILASKLAGDADENEVALMASLIEVIHTASLIHDDIVDGAEKRRGASSVPSQWGVQKAVLIGDFFFINAIGMSLDRHAPRIVRLMTDLAAQMIEGEIREYGCQGRADLDEEGYMEIIGMKTASLFATSARIGAILGKASPDIERRLESLGRNLGMAFQIVDDVLDFTGEAEILGKPVLADMDQGRVTLPVIHALSSCGKSEADKLRGSIGRTDASDRAREEILEIVSRNGSLDYARRRAADSRLDGGEARRSFSAFSFPGVRHRALPVRPRQEKVRNPP